MPTRFDSCVAAVDKSTCDRGPANLLVYESYAFGQIGGELRSVAYFLQFLNRARYRPSVVVPSSTPVLGTWAEEARVECVAVPAPGRLVQHGGRTLRSGVAGFVATAVAAVRYWVTLFRLIRTRQVHVVCCWSLRAILTIAPAARLARRPVLWVVNGRLENPCLDVIGLLLASRVVFQCAANRDDRYRGLVRALRRKVRVVHSGIDVNRLDRAAGRSASIRAELGLSATRLNLAVVGQLSPPKGTHHVVKALALLPPERRNVRLFIVGDILLDVHSDYPAYLRRLVEEHGLGDHVCFTGWRKDALEILAEMDVLVHASMAEGMPRVVLEAMGLGKAVVATAVGCTREIIVDGVNGMLVAPDDVSALADRIDGLIQHPDLRAQLGAAARRTILAGHPIAQQTERLEDVLEEVVSR